MNYKKIRLFLFKRNIAIFKEDGWNFKIFPDPYRKIKTTFNLEISSFFLFLLNKTKIHPNLVTYFGIFWVYLGVFCFYLNNLFSIFMGLIIFFTKLIPDYIDGALAFLKKKQSSKGHYLDLFAGNINKLGFVIGSLIYIYFSTNNISIIYCIFFIIFIFFTDPRIYKKRFRVLYDKKTSSHKENIISSKEIIIKKYFKFLNYDGRTSYSDLVILLILIDYIYEVNIFLNYLPWLWLSLFLMSYLQAWYKFYKKIK